MRTVLRAVLALVAFTTASNAEDVEFGGLVSTSCTINVLENGIITQNASARVIASGQPGGRHGRASVTTTGLNFSIRAVAPTAFSSQPAADTSSPETFVARVRGNSNTVFPFTDAAQPLNLGTSNLRVHLRAQKAGQVSFANGDYTAFVTLLCE